MVVALTIAPPIPCKKRRAMTISIELACEIKPPANAKSSNPIWKILRRP